MEKLNSLSFAEERILCSVEIERDQKGSLGLQIMEGSDGNVYIQSVIPGGPADKTGNILHGDQVVTVDGESLLGMKYNQALNLLKNRGNRVVFILARAMPDKYSQASSLSRINMSNLKETSQHIRTDYNYPIDKLYLYPKVRESPPLEKHLTEICFDNTNFHKYGLVSKYNVDVPYHKHIRYEIDTLRDKTKFKIPMVVDSFRKNSLNKTLSKSCSHIFTDSSVTDKAVIVEMIPKDNIDLSQFHSLDKKNLKQCRIDDKFAEDSRGTMSPIALPRSLGLSRKWRGPVRYPVTPVKNIDDNDTDSFNYVSASDEEQIFI